MPCRGRGRGRPRAPGHASAGKLSGSRPRRAPHQALHGTRHMLACGCRATHTREHGTADPPRYAQATATQVISERREAQQLLHLQQHRVPGALLCASVHCALVLCEVHTPLQRAWQTRRRPSVAGHCVGCRKDPGSPHSKTCTPPFPTRPR